MHNNAVEHLAPTNKHISSSKCTPSQNRCQKLTKGSILQNAGYCTDVPFDHNMHPSKEVRTQTHLPQSRSKFIRTTFCLVCTPRVHRVAISEKREHTRTLKLCAFKHLTKTTETHEQKEERAGIVQFSPVTSFVPCSGTHIRTSTL